MVVDAAIVVLENIFRLKEKGENNNAGEYNMMEENDGLGPMA